MASDMSIIMLYSSPWWSLLKHFGKEVALVMSICLAPSCHAVRGMLWASVSCVLQHILWMATPYPYSLPIVIATIAT